MNEGNSTSDPEEESSDEIEEVTQKHDNSKKGEEKMEMVIDKNAENSNQEKSKDNQKLDGEKSDADDNNEENVELKMDGEIRSQEQEEQQNEEREDVSMDIIVEQTSFHVPLTAVAGALRSAEEIEKNRLNALTIRRLREKQQLPDVTPLEQETENLQAKTISQSQEKDSDNDEDDGDPEEKENTTLKRESKVVEENPVEGDSDLSSDSTHEPTTEQEMLGSVISVLGILEDLDSILDIDADVDIGEKQSKECNECKILTEKVKQLEEGLARKEKSIDILNTVTKAHETLLKDKKEEIEGMNTKMSELLEKFKLKENTGEIKRNEEIRKLVERLRTITKEKEVSDNLVLKLKQEVGYLHHLNKDTQERSSPQTLEVMELNKRLEEELVLRKEEIESKEETISKMQEELAKEREGTSKKNDLQIVLSQECEKTGKQVGELKEKLKLVTEEKAGVESKLIIVQKQVDELRKTAEKNREEIKEREAELTKEVDRSSNKMKEMSENCKKVEKEVALKKEDIRNKEKVIKDLKGDLEKEKKKGKDISVVEEKLLAATEKISITSQKLSDSNDNINELLSELRGRSVELQQKEQEINVLEERIVKAHSTIELQEENIQQLRDENIRTKNDIKQKKQNQENLAKPLDDYDKFKKTIEKRFDELTKVVLDLKSSEANQKSGSKPGILRNSRREVEPESTSDDDELLQRNSKSSSKSRKVMQNQRVRIVDSDEEEFNSKSRKLKVVPGEHTYSEAATQKQSSKHSKDIIKGKKALVFSTSITKHIDVRRFNRGFTHGRARFQRWHGGEVEHIKSYVVSHLEKDRPDTVILQMGGNDLHRGDKRNTATITDIANDIIETALICRNHGVRDIFIGGVTVRRQRWTWEVCESLNKALEGQCLLHDFTFFSNGNIRPSDLYDGVHLNEDGVSKMANNMLDSLFYHFSEEN